MTTPERPDDRTAEDALASVIQTILTLPADAGQPEITIGHRAASAGGGWYWAVHYRTVIGSGKTYNSAVDQRLAIADATRSYLEAVDRDRGIITDDEDND
jgi:hypothetical protein